MTTKQKKAEYQRLWRNRQTPEKQERIKQQIRDWHHKHKESQRLDKLIWRRHNRDKYNALARSRISRYKSRYPDKWKVLRAFYRKKAKALRRARTINLQSSPCITIIEWFDIIDMWYGKCAYCSQPCSNPTQDHIVPLSKGGQHTASNIVPACQPCNSRKSNKNLADFLYERWLD